MKSIEITETQIINITEKCSPRERAFFTIMRQSGLIPIKIKRLRIKDVDGILEPEPLAPLKLNVPHEKYPTFIGQEATDYLKKYLIKRERRKELTHESLLFTARNNPKKEINTKSVSRAFKDSAGKSSKLQLRNLIEFYNANTKNYQHELKELRENNTSKDDQFYRELYKQEAMQHLEIEPQTQIETLKKRQQKLENTLRKIENYFPEKQKSDSEKYLEEHPEEARRIREQDRWGWEQAAKEIRKKMKIDEKWREEHPEEARLRDEAIEKFEEQYNREHFEKEAKVYRDFYEIIGNIVGKSRDRAKRHGKTPS